MSAVFEKGRIGQAVGIDPLEKLQGTRMAEDSAQVYDELKDRLKRLGLTGNRFQELMGLSETTMFKWRSIGTPAYALNFLNILEKFSVSASWRATRSQPGPTQDDATAALRAPLTAVVDEAIQKGWNRSQIAAALRQLASETDGSASL